MLGGDKCWGVVDNKCMKFVSYMALAYNDVLLEPRYSNVRGSDADTRVTLHEKLALKIPVLSSPMDTVTESGMAIALARVGGLGIIHRNLAPEDQMEQVRHVKSAEVENHERAAVDGEGRLLVGAAIGPGDEAVRSAQGLIDAGVDVICIDSAQGHSEYVIESVRKFKSLYSEFPLIAGNVATQEGALRLIKAGADILRVGIGPGAICTTRVVAGIGVPQLSAVIECVRCAKHMGVPVIADGGIKYSGDIVKALAGGASAVMLGSLLARTQEAPGDVVEEDGKSFKRYRGMGSVGAMVKGSAARYGQEGVDKKNLVAEGVEGLVPMTGTVEEYVHQLIGGVRAGMAYIGAATLEEMPRQARFIQMSAAGLVESHPHSLKITDGGRNYSG